MHTWKTKTIFNNTKLLQVKNNNNITLESSCYHFEAYIQGSILSTLPLLWEEQKIWISVFFSNSKSNKTFQIVMFYNYTTCNAGVKYCCRRMKKIINYSDGVFVNAKPFLQSQENEKMPVGGSNYHSVPSLIIFTFSQTGWGIWWPLVPHQIQCTHWQLHNVCYLRW